MKNQLMKVKQVSQKLNLSIHHTYTLIRLGEIPSVRIGKNIRIIPQDLNKYIEANKSVITIAPIMPNSLRQTASLENHKANRPLKEIHHVDQV